MINIILRKTRSLIFILLNKFRIFKEISFIKLKKANYEIGSPEWLAFYEHKFGGYISKVKVNEVSDNDLRSKKELETTGRMIGGDRMIHHDYAKNYSKFLRPFLDSNKNIVLVECGILMGTGLAVWSKLFPDASLIGLDIDINYFKQNYKKLKNLGAFTNVEPKLLKFDQFNPNTEKLEIYLNGRGIDIFIDDGLHSEETIKNTLRSVKKLMSKSFVYFIEDNEFVSDSIQIEHPDLDVISFGQLTVIRPK